MISMSFLTTLALLLLVLKLPKKLVRFLVIQGFWTDLFITVGIFVIFAGSGTVTGNFVGVLVGLYLSILLWAAKKLLRWAEADGTRGIPLPALPTLPQLPQPPKISTERLASITNKTLSATSHSLLLVSYILAFCVCLVAATTITLCVILPAYQY